MFGRFKQDRSSEMGAYHMAIECELMNLEEARQGFLELLDSDLEGLQALEGFSRTEAENCMVELMQDYDIRRPEIESAIRGRLDAYRDDAAKNGLDKQFDQYLQTRFDMLRFNLAFRAMNKHASFCEKHNLPDHTV
jgi:hypothetical protein